MNSPPHPPTTLSGLLQMSLDGPTKRGFSDKYENFIGCHPLNFILVEEHIGNSIFYEINMPTTTTLHLSIFDTVLKLVRVELLI